MPPRDTEQSWPGHTESAASEREFRGGWGHPPGELRMRAEERRGVVGRLHAKGQLRELQVLKPGRTPEPTGKARRAQMPASYYKTRACRSEAVRPRSAGRAPISGPLYTQCPVCRENKVRSWISLRTRGGYCALGDCAFAACQRARLEIISEVVAVRTIVQVSLFTPSATSPSIGLVSVWRRRPGLALALVDHHLSPEIWHRRHPRHGLEAHRNGQHPSHTLTQSLQIPTGANRNEPRQVWAGSAASLRSKSRRAAPPTAS